MEVLLPLRISICKSICKEMKNIESNESNYHRLFQREKVYDPIIEINTRGSITYEGEYSSLKFQRKLYYPSETIWKEITDPKRLSEWMNTKAIINGKRGGTIDFVNTISGFHTSGDILIWEPNRIFEHEWHIAPNPSLPQGELNSIIRWELEQDGELNTLLTLIHNRLGKSISLRFAPGWHAYLDRLEANLDNKEPPNWMHRFGEVKELYSE